MYCKKCGKPMRPEDRFCKSCGTAAAQKSANLNGTPYSGSGRGMGPGMTDYDGQKQDPSGGKRGLLIGIIIALAVLILAVIILLVLNLSAKDVETSDAEKEAQELQVEQETEVPAQEEEPAEEEIQQPADGAEQTEGEKHSLEGMMPGQTGDGTQDHGFIFSDSDSRYLERQEVEYLTKEELSLARNEIYARRGRMFNSEELQQYFDSCDWYVPLYTPEAFDAMGGDSVLNEYELANKDLIVEIETAKGYR